LYINGLLNLNLTKDHLLKKKYSSLKTIIQEQLGPSVPIIYNPFFLLEDGETGNELGCLARLSCFCSTGGTCRVTLVKNPIISHERGMDGIVNMTNGLFTCKSSFVTHNPFVIKACQVMMAIVKLSK